MEAGPTFCITDFGVSNFYDLLFQIMLLLTSLQQRMGFV